MSTPLEGEVTSEQDIKYWIKQMQSIMDEYKKIADEVSKEMLLI